MRRDIFAPEHEDFRSLVKSFVAKEMAPAYPAWEKAGIVPREVFKRLGVVGIMGMNFGVDHGGGGHDDYRFNVVLQEETAAAGVTIGPLRTHLDVVVPYFRRYASPSQQRRWFPGLCSGDLLAAIALTEPDMGSDLAGVRTRAVRQGDEYVVTGAKTFITGGALADLVIVLARTTTDPDDRRRGLSLLVVENGMPGFVKGRKLQKIGLRSQDTVDLAFDNVRVPTTNRLGEEGHAFGYLTSNLPQERMAIAVGAVAQSRAALELTVDWVKERHIFGKPLATFQNTKFEIAAMTTELDAAQAMVDNATMDLVAGTLAPSDAARVKLFCTEVQGRIVDRCLQLFGGMGYITESPISRYYTDARVTRIYGGTSEVMKSIIAKSLGL